LKIAKLSLSWLQVELGASSNMSQLDKLQKDHVALEVLVGSEKATLSELLASLGAHVAEAIKKSETTEQNLALGLEKTKKLEWDQLAEE
jgi:hypothetical protein